VSAVVDLWQFSRDQTSARSILARHLGRDLSSLQFAYGRYGKPRLVQGAGLEFSCAYSGGVGVLAVARDCALGVDVERIEPRRALGPIADQLFAEDEAAELRGLPDERRVARFFQLWTRKEAYGKALGTGLSMPLRRLRPPAGWEVQELDVGPGFAGALCIHGQGFGIRIHE
jgi:4'-phosphopantetheinyl transferase